MYFPLTAVIGITRQEKEKTCTPKNYKAKLKRLRSARLTRCDQAVTHLDMQRLQAIKTYKPTTIIFKQYQVSFSHV
jgi:hypothetical protein